jgi:hypothetical protein
MGSFTGLVSETTSLDRSQGTHRIWHAARWNCAGLASVITALASPTVYAAESLRSAQTTNKATSDDRTAIWLGLSSAFGLLDYYDRLPPVHLATFTSVSLVGEIGFGFPIGQYLELGPVFLAGRHQAIAETDRTAAGSLGGASLELDEGAGGYGVTVAAVGLRATGYFVRGDSPFLAGAFRGGFSSSGLAASYSLELGYLFHGLFGGYDTSVAIGYEYTLARNPLNDESTSYVERSGFLALRVNLSSNYSNNEHGSAPTRKRNKLRSER